MAKIKRNVIFFHPDLGIGGAERLVVDAAVGLQKQGHKVTIFTSHCDPKHCFEEARDGTLDVRVRGNTIVPQSVFSRLSILCAILRQLHLVLQISFFGSELRDLQPGVFFIDQLSACVPLLRLRFPKVPVLFYCHFPDKLLVYREGLLKKLYRVPFDWLEAWSTGCSSTIMVNSEFTGGIFAEAFPGLRQRRPQVVYPCVDIPSENEMQKKRAANSDPLWKDKKALLSINRFERKKDIGLAIKAFAKIEPSVRSSARLVVAGGYDMRISENVNYHKELEELAATLHLKTATAKTLVSALSIPEDIDLLFLLSVPTSLKDTLLQASSLLVYTPKFEHFGIVPLEAMLAGVPVLAAKTGGPRETVVDGKTGWLRNHDNPEQWTEVMSTVLAGVEGRTLKAMGEAGRTRVAQLFSQSTMASRLNKVISEARIDSGTDPLKQSAIAVAVIFAASALFIAVGIATRG